RSFAAPVRVSDDHWQFDGCPENGPAVALDRARRAHVFWLTPLDGKDGAPLVLYHAVSRDGRAFAPRQRVATEGIPGHVQTTVAPDGALVATWDELSEGGRRVVFARGVIDASGQAQMSAALSLERGQGHHPVVATTSRDVVAAWVHRGEQANTISVARVAASRR
ncbi:MAG: hypothetical protein ABIT38_00975, partial [Gemmatimonadaceae bacterium]